MILARLNVRQKLTLLLILPFIAVLLTSVPFAVGQINTAVAAGATVGVASQARDVGVLVQDLQEERLLALAFLATPDADQSAFVERTASTDDHAASVEGSLELPRDVKLKSAIGGLRALTNLRQSILRRTTAPAAVFTTYHDTVVRLIDALRLTQQEKADATGIRQMGTLDALLRTNEETGRVGAALVLASTDPEAAIPLVEEAQLLRRSAATRFRQQADAEENTLLNLVEQGPTGRRADALAKRLTTDGQRLSLTESLSAAQTIITLTRVQQERIARDIATRADTRASAARITAGVIIGLAALLVGVVILLSMAVSRSVSGPLRRLTAAAVNVAEVATAELVRVADSEIEDAEPPKVEAVEVQTEDEIGELAVAFNRVQMTAARLMEQQIATRRNTAVMFANIARRTRSMVSRQLTFIDDLERNEQNERLLAKLYRLDHLTTRLHRSADSLLVVSGAREDERIVSPAPLSEVVRSAVAEIEGYQNVQVGGLVPATISPALVPDLRLVLAELLENATAFSPPGSPVEVTSALTEDSCQIRIIDHGIGMSDERLAEENRRLVERERLDIVPTSVLGLFVVGRLARRHGLNIQLTHTGDQGITATVTVPPGLYIDPNRKVRQPEIERDPSTLTEPRQQPVGLPGGRPAAAPVAAPTSPVQYSDLAAVPPPAVPPVVEPAPVLPAAVEPERVEPVAVEPEPVEPERVEPVAVEPERVEPVAVEPEPVEPEPVLPIAVSPPAPQAPERPVPAIPTRSVEPREIPRVEPAAAEPARAEEPVHAEPVASQPALPEPVASQPALPEPPDKLAWFVPPPNIPGAAGVGGPVPPAAMPVQPPIRGEGEQLAEPKIESPRAEPGPERPIEPRVERPAEHRPERRGEPGPTEPRPVLERSGERPRSGPRHAGQDESAPAGLRGLTRRKPGGHLPSFGIGSDDFRTAPVARDAVAERAELEAFAMGTAQAAAARLKKVGSDLVEPNFGAPPAAQPADGELSRLARTTMPEPAPPARPEISRQERPEPVRPEPARHEAAQPERRPAEEAGGDSQPRSRSGLTRRRPGSHLSEYLRSAAEPRPVHAQPSSRDADAERAALDSFLDGLARASTTPDQVTHR